MNFECPTCNLSGKIDDSKIAEHGIYAICPKCKTRFLINAEFKFDMHQKLPPEKSVLVTCPKCGFQQSENTTCNSCGVIFSKFKPVSESPSMMAQLKFLQPNEITSLIGREHLLEPDFKNIMAYVRGIKEIDDLRQDDINDLNPEGLSKSSSLTLRELGIMISIGSTFRCTALRYSDIVSIQVQPLELLAEKNKSVIGRAIVGGLVFGPLGAIVGGMSGIGTTNIQYDYLFNFTYRNSFKNEGQVLFVGQKSDCIGLLPKLKAHLGSKVSID